MSSMTEAWRYSKANQRNHRFRLLRIEFDAMSTNLATVGRNELDSAHSLLSVASSADETLRDYPNKTLTAYSLLGHRGLLAPLHIKKQLQDRPDSECHVRVMIVCRINRNVFEGEGTGRTMEEAKEAACRRALDDLGRISMT